MGSRMIFRGEARLCLLAVAEEKAVHICQTVPFSQIIELDCEADSAQAYLCLTGSRVDLAHDEQGRAVANIQLSILAQGSATVSHEMSYVADAYSNAMDCALCFEELLLPKGSQNTILHHEHRSRMDTPTPVREIVAAIGRCAAVSADDGELRLKLSLECLYLDDDNVLRRAEQSEIIKISDASITGNCSAAAVCPEVYAVPSTGGAEIRAAIEAKVHCDSVESITMVKDIELTERQEALRRPSVYVVPNRGESNWELAKKYFSTVELIENMNAEPGNIILIPVCHN